MLFDTHTHLNDEKYNDNLDEVIKRSFDSNVKRMIVVGYDLKSSLKAIEIAKKYPNIFACIGIHPSNIKECKEEDFEKIEELLSINKVVAIGEIGLDYHWDKDNHEHQKNVFSFFIKLAYKYKKPIVIHSRDAAEDTLRVLNENKEYLTKGVMHCYSYSKEISRQFLGLGMLLSFGGPLTFTNARTSKEVVLTTPLEKIMLETDCPYLTPHPYRGQINEPFYIKLVAEQLALLKNVSLDEIEKITYQNASEFFGV